MRILLADAQGRNVLDAIIPGGAGWSENTTGTNWHYDGPGDIGGITRVRIVKRPAPSRLRFLVIGKHGDYAMTPAQVPLVGTMVIDSPVARTGQCGEIRFREPGRCACDARSTTLKCR